jgi:hypothetical protein
MDANRLSNDCQLARGKDLISSAIDSRLYDSIKEIATELSGNQKIVFTGHSLGGYFAVFFLMKLLII